MRWFLPSWSGDFRLEKDGSDACTLTVVDPTPAEIERLGQFLKKARSKGWIDQHVGFVPNGEVKIHVNAPLVKAGRILLGEKWKGVLTAVRSTSGKITAIIDDDAEKVEKEVAKPDAEAAVSTRRPTLCCPHPLPGPDQRASEVLQTFSTTCQWDDWQREGMLACRGNLSGRRYEITHRHHPLAIQRGKIVWDPVGQHVLHCYDWSVPPAEEVLTMKLTLEHAEHWIRNPSGYLAWCHQGGPIYPNPFVPHAQGTDGMADAAFVRELGSALSKLFSE